VARYAELVEALLEAPAVTQSDRKGFGFAGLMIGGKLFATLRQDELLLKLPAVRVAALIDAGEARSFDAGRGRPMKQWVLVSAASPAWLQLAREALRFVRDDR
jgi:hypothetical protein